MRTLPLGRFLWVVLCVVVVPWPVLANSIAIMNGTVHTVTDAGVIEEGDVLIDGDVISGVGGNLRPVGDPQIIDATGKIVTPGFFSALTSIGLEEISIDSEANDTRPDWEFPLSAALDGALGFNPRSTVIPVTRVAGVTRAFATPIPASNVFGGQGFVADMSGADGSITKPWVAQIASAGSGGADLAGNTRLGAWALLTEHLDRARLFAADPTAYRRDEREQRFSLSDIQALAPVINNEQLLLIGVHRADDLRRIIALKAEYQVDVAVFGGAEAWRVAQDLADAAIPVILDPLQNLPSKFESLGSTLENAARLHAAGVKIAFYDSEIGFTHNARLLPQLAGNAVANGLPYDAAMTAVTRNPAEIFGVGDFLGSLAPDKVADVVVWDGDPFEVTSRPEMVIIAGKILLLETRQTKLRDRYRDLTRGDLPPAYRH